MPRVNLFLLFRVSLIGAALFTIAIYLLQAGRNDSHIWKLLPAIPSPSNEGSTDGASINDLYWKTPLSTPPSCDDIPDRAGININNLYWQTLITANISFYFFNGYYDSRSNIPVRPAVRVTAMVNATDLPKLYCRLWFSSRRSVIVNVSSYDYMWFRHWKLKKELRPYLISCPIPKSVSKLVPQYVSFVTRNETCERATNLIKVIYERTVGRKTFGVCVKGLDFPEDVNGTSARLVEWLEIQWLLGVDRVIFYVLQIHPNIRTVLKHYQSLDRVQVMPLTLPGDQPNDPKAQHVYLAKNKRMKRLDEVIPYNDCFYRNLYRYKYIALLDTDEVIMPLGAGSTWSQMLKAVTPKAKKSCSKKAGFASYMARNVYFMDDFQHKKFEDIPGYMHMLQNINRTANHTDGRYMKGLHRTDAAVTLHNHITFSHLNKYCNFYKMEPEDALLYHYRTYCVGDMGKKKCEVLRDNVVQDTGMWRYKRLLTERTTKTLRKLGILSIDAT